jgi:hypothetical protein
MDRNMNLRLIKLTFLTAALYGTVLMISMLIHPPQMLGRAPWQQPEIYYGFATMGLAWQVVFFLIAADPFRYRTLMLVSAIYDKFAFVIVLVVLLIKHRARPHWIPPAILESVFALAFFLAYLSTPTATKNTKMD